MPDLWRTIVAGFLTGLLLLSFVSTGATPSDPRDYFKITVVDQETGRGVPLVELKTTNNVRYYTDSNGIIAFFEPALMATEPDLRGEVLKRATQPICRVWRNPMSSLILDRIMPRPHGKTRGTRLG